MFKKFLLISAFAGLLLAGCDCADCMQTPRSVVFNIAFEALTFEPAAGETQPIHIVSHCEWSLVGDLPSWLSVTPESGARSTANVAITVTEDNTGSAPRSHLLTFTAPCGDNETVLVTQLAPIVYAVGYQGYGKYYASSDYPDSLYAVLWTNGAMLQLDERCSIAEDVCAAADGTVYAAGTQGKETLRQGYSYYRYQGDGHYATLWTVKDGSVTPLRLSDEWASAHSVCRAADGTLYVAGTERIIEWEYYPERGRDPDIYIDRWVFQSAENHLVLWTVKDGSVIRKTTLSAFAVIGEQVSTKVAVCELNGTAYVAGTESGSPGHILWTVKDGGITGKTFLSNNRTDPGVALCASGGKVYAAGNQERGPVLWTMNGSEISEEDIPLAPDALAGVVNSICAAGGKVYASLVEIRAPGMENTDYMDQFCVRAMDGTTYPLVDVGQLYIADACGMGNSVYAFGGTRKIPSLWANGVKWNYEGLLPDMTEVFPQAVFVR